MSLVLIELTELVEIINNAVLKALEISHSEIPPPNSNSSLINVKQVAKLLNVSESSVNTYKRLGYIPFHRIGRRVFFKEDEVLASLKKINQ
jgi:excisionase family DNA binding protein